MNIDNIIKAAEYISKGTSMLSAGPLSFYLTELVAAQELLMSRFAPFKVGDRVCLKKTPSFDASPGWAHCAHFLVPGAKATVCSAGCGSKGFRFGVAFDDESWIDEYGRHGKKGAYVPIKNKHEFGFAEGWLELAPSAHSLRLWDGKQPFAATDTVWVESGAVNVAPTPDQFLPLCGWCRQPAGSHLPECRLSEQGT